MNTLLRTGITIVVFALASYTTAVITQIRRRSMTVMMRVFLTVGVALDATSTGFMIAGSSRMPFTVHGVLGYSALFLMAVDLVLMWRFYARKGTERIPGALHRYSLIAFSWWVTAFVAGTIMVVLL